MSRSNLVATLVGARCSAPIRGRDDASLVQRIRRITDQKISFGYRRVTAALKREKRDVVNHKRVYRVMRDCQLLLPKHASRPTRTHDGKLITLRSDTPWCSDAFEIRCWNGERVRVAFTLDCCDRGSMGYVAEKHALSGQHIRDLMALALDARFPGQQRVPAPIQWLSDNGPCYTAHETRTFGSMLGLTVCNTPSYSPQSNGMAEAFVKTFKRDYVYVNRLDTADLVLDQLAAWFADYNEHHPHKGLRMMSPNKYRRLSLSG